jgi:hypothetical protein
MNYWPSESTQLSELNEPLIQLVRDLSETSQDAASLMYGARGWMEHHNTDIWRISGGVDWSWGAWPTSNAWLVEHLWQKNQLTYLKVTSRLGGNLRLRSYVPLPEPHNFKQKNAIGENKNRFYQLPTTKPVLKNTRLNLSKISLADSFLIDVVTTLGQSYVWRQ